MLVLDKRSVTSNECIHFTIISANIFIQYKDSLSMNIYISIRKMYMLVLDKRSVASNECINFTII